MCVHGCVVKYYLHSSITGNSFVVVFLTISQWLDKFLL